ncbi:hypothetical protein OG455_09250 [Kitasatospora sp. NBC_01287]|uniref:hypothetical protein n=1 Tax=Kitasatospora sp. NBC_01287 TaxID=2903573 RepID=UPI002252B050|nr:hypothetical protein [Kitasatospora sp. NBC_01287]MCX4745706.1 hypothetical protein [Kitasatospora sp. NBC_01287]
MNTPQPQQPRTDSQLAALDVGIMLRFGLPAEGAHRSALFADGAVAAAIAADGLGVLPRALTFLGEVVRAGGTRYAAALPEPLPGGAAAALARGWLEAAAMVVTDPSGDLLAARWLEAVAAVLALRITHREAAS